MLYMPEGMPLNEVVAKEVVPLPTDSEAIAMKLIAGSDRLKSRTKKAVQDFDDAMKLFRKLYHEDGEISYKDETEDGVQCLLSHAQECQGGARGDVLDGRGMEGFPQDRLGSSPPLPLILLITKNALLNLQALKS